MGSDDGVLAVEQGMSGIQRRLGLEHVDARARQVAVVQRVGQGLGIHHRAAGGVDDIGPPLHLGDVLPADEAPGVVVQRAVERDDVRLGQQLIQGDEGDKGGLVPPHMALIAQHPAPEGMAQLGGPEADGSDTHDAHRLAPELHPHQAVLGLAGAAAGLHLRHVAQQGEHQAQTQLGHRLR